MKKLYVLLYLSVICASLYSQLDSIFVEKYYVSGIKDMDDTVFIYDINDEYIIDTVSLIPGTITYRIYLAMRPGYRLTSVFADADHPIRISSTESFFNHSEGGAIIGKDIKKSGFIRSPTLPLDTWITLGYATSTELGVPKMEDTDGSLYTVTSEGFLTNETAESGIPLTTSDGLISLTSIPKTWVQNGLQNEDTTIFGPLNSGKQFVSYSAYLKNSGVMSALTDRNNVLIAQLTTRGDISFELNVQLTDTADNSG
jgi:hypothetical protein